MTPQLLKNFDDDDWRLLLESLVVSHQVIPVIGEELSRAVRADGTEAAWLELIAEALASAAPLLLSYSDARFAQAPFAAKFAQAHRKLFLRLRDGELRHRRGESPQPGDLRLSEPLRRLAEIPDFPLLATTAPDGLLALALSIEAGEGETLVLDKTDWSRRVVPLNAGSNCAAADADLRPNWTPAPGRCTPVYHLFGLTAHLNGNRPMNDADQLGRIIHLAGARPHTGILGAFARHRILILGTRTPDCLTASFIRLLKGCDGRESCFGETLVSHPASRPADTSLVEFLAREGSTEVLETLDAAAFVAELHRRSLSFKAALPAQPQPNALDDLRQPPAMCLFLSYASEDRAIAQQVFDALTARKIPVWFDRVRLDGGEPWDERMRYAVDKCRLFLPLVTPRSARTPGVGGRYYLQEWTWACDRAPARTGTPFIYPLFAERLDAAGAEYLGTHFPRFDATQGAPSLADFLSDAGLAKIEAAYYKAAGVPRFLAGPAAP